jgi:hypothetical protein
MVDELKAKDLSVLTAAVDPFIVILPRVATTT